MFEPYSFNTKPRPSVWTFDLQCSLRMIRLPIIRPVTGQEKTFFDISSTPLAIDMLVLFWFKTFRDSNHLAIYNTHLSYVRFYHLNNLRKYWSILTCDTINRLIIWKRSLEIVGNASLMVSLRSVPESTAKRFYFNYFSTETNVFDVDTIEINDNKGIAKLIRKLQ